MFIAISILLCAIPIWGIFILMLVQRLKEHRNEKANKEIVTSMKIE